MSDPREKLGRLSPEEQRALLAQRLLARAAQPKTFVPSFSQQRLWFLDQLGLSSAVYHVPLALRLTGPLATDALERALNEIVRRHAVLRTHFGEQERQLRQVVVPKLQLEIEQIDLTALPPDIRAKRLRVLSTEKARCPFDLAKGPLLRAVLFRLAPSEHVLLLTMHHIVSDGWSIGILIQELAALYAAFRSGQPSPLPELPIQYADFATWQQQWLSGKVLEEQLSYWQKQLAGAPALLELPTDRPRPPVQSYRGETFQFETSASLLAGLQQLARQSGATLFMVLLAAFKVLLSRYSRQEDIVVGTPIANRNRSEIEPLIGFFVNTLVLRTDLGGEPSFRELLGRVREVTLEAFDHQDLPFEKLVEHLQPERLLSHNPLFQVMFTLQNAPTAIPEMGNLAIEYAALETGVARADLTLAMGETAAGLSAGFEYSTDLFAPETIARMAGHLLTLLEAVVADPDQPITSLPLLSGTERAQLLALAAPRQHFEPGLCVHQRFEQQVERTPEAVALVWGEEKLSYRELNHRANQLAHHLQALGVGAEVLVGICLERSPELIVSLLAVLKAGGAYVPLDPAYPGERLAFMIQDAGLAVLISNSALVGKLNLEVPRLVQLDTDDKAIEAASTANPVSSVGTQNLAYVIYTSGSTGKPKGVLVEHGQIARLFTATAPWFHFGPEDVWTLFHSFAFDFSVWEIWGALAHGGRLVIVPYATSRSPEDFYALLVREAVTVLNQTPSAFRQLIEAERHLGVDPSLALRLVIFGGEALDLVSLRPWFECHDEVQPQLVNMYGITETTVHVTYRPIGRSDAEQPTGSVIGEAIPDLELHLLDPGGEPVAVGVPGELYVGGAGVARGYLNRPELNRERFLKNRFRPDSRLYRTGDLARRRAGGDLEYLGRIDQQVKIRGFRIELGEIEAALASHPDLRAALVLAREDVPGDRRLVAYAVPEPGATPVESSLRRHLQQRLPEYMVPSAFVLLEGLPLTANGKLDRAALPAPGICPDQRSEAVEPRTPLETVIAEIWCELLQREAVGVHDDFFALGGHSLLATQVITQMREVLEVEVPLLYLFETPTVAALTGRLTADPEHRHRLEKRAQLLLELAELPEAQVQALIDKRANA
ncbi:non-ribosomal peptide synthetase [Gloeobacter kilaueensis]|uniref:Cyclohexanecarboxylate-CoA ligase n=1 Tax=Gloeobacter kilaueensis (strain ATCC BAA-2537 / CCAP 1431/1 / ULC 316 / JS1) TaxID=1183438 RepID=U5QGH0_GLOK1|nr:non-ribosomal peptide synthetase [Gloeobacter kilaueensis]AGY58062.1 cyclohexanecarboxylate-CoA ligase [Gloeobacter kilaueensis JS1]